MKSCSKCGERPRATYSDGRPRSWCNACLSAASAAWRAAHPDYKRSWQAANPDRAAVYDRRWSLTHPGRAKMRSHTWSAANPDRVAAHKRTYRARKAGVAAIIRRDSFDCALCFGPLIPSLKFPDPMSTTVGHEPPLSRMRGLGLSIVVERPEHLICNLRKHNRLDSELTVQRLEWKDI